jgi:hypothetical protein
VAQAEAILEALRRAEVPRAVFNAGGAVWSVPPGLPFLDARTRLAEGLPRTVPTAVVVGPATAYMENLSESWVVERLRARGELVQMAPPEAGMSPVAVDDVASTIAGVLVEEDPPPRVVVHGPGKITGEEAARAISAHLGRPVRWTRVDPEEYLRGVAKGLGGQYARNIGRLYGAGVPPPDAPGPGKAAYESASEEARKVLDLACNRGVREQANHELLLGIVVASQAAQIQDLRERLAQLEVAD